MFSSAREVPNGAFTQHALNSLFMYDLLFVMYL